MSLSDYQGIVDELLRDDGARISPDQRNRALALAVERYGTDRPRQVVEDVAGDGTRALALPTGWQADFSDVRSIEYPIGNIPPTEFETWELYQGPSSTVIHLPSAVANAANARVTYTARHTLSFTTDTLPVRDREAVSAYAAAILCDQLANLFSQSSDSTIGADSVEHRSQAQEYDSRARALRKRYLDQLGIEPKRAVAAGVVVEHDNPSSLGSTRLTHPERWR